ncbi:hypothetical protein PVAND_004376 [Polypedilum vanderplanki]|uniref:Uncharacterized protein n=1 Tax=Polypedilum vanderplanki TaxID=319348 RepID=A0A9J6BXE0_POLVA|nr:hypothetical protein PVAND_004376 [Polypedilum vanderplanki]
MEKHHKSSSSNHKYESIHALIQNLHGGSTRSLTRRQSHNDINELARSSSNRSVSSVHTLPILEVEKLSRKSVFDFKIPLLTITGPHLQTPESPDDHHRRFSFGHFRRHSHTVRI